MARTGKTLTINIFFDATTQVCANKADGNNALIRIYDSSWDVWSDYLKSFWIVIF